MSQAVARRCPSGELCRSRDSNPDARRPGILSPKQAHSADPATARVFAETVAAKALGTLPVFPTFPCFPPCQGKYGERKGTVAGLPGHPLTEPPRELRYLQGSTPARCPFSGGRVGSCWRRSNISGRSSFGHILIALRLSHRHSPLEPAAPRGRRWAGGPTLRPGERATRYGGRQVDGHRLAAHASPSSRISTRSPS